MRYEYIYLKPYETPREPERGLEQYFNFYNARRRHTFLGRRTPDTVYFGEFDLP